jgi:SAM-dependent methyltransferase
VALAHHFLRNVVKPGDRVVDATCGNGNDTLFLARLVGEHGCVWAFDIQPLAIEKTAALLAAHQCDSQVELIADGHESLSALVKGPLSAAVFNLGFLPGGDKGCITHGETTIAALAQAAALLVAGGIVTVAVYPGHSGGDDESQAVEQWASGLSPHIFNVWRHRQLNRSAVAPYLILVERRPS